MPGRTKVAGRRAAAPPPRLTPLAVHGVPPSDVLFGP